MKHFSAFPWSASFLFFSLLPPNPLLAARENSGLLKAAPAQDAIVIGFVGGFVHRNATLHQEVQLADELRKDYPLRTAVRIFENHMGKEAHEEVLHLLDTDHDGILSTIEKLKARIVLYGHSWGASEAVSLARRLEKDGIPVLLTIQVDSVSKLGKDDRLIPPNVSEAVNYYQSDGFLHGRRKIFAVNPLRTHILGNFRFGYKTRQIDCSGYPWYAQAFMKPHIEIESDPTVWHQIDLLIRSKLPASAIH